MRLNKILAVGCLMLAFPAASFAETFNQDDLFKTKATSGAAGSFARTAAKINSNLSQIDEKSLRAKLEFANSKIAQEPNNYRFYGGRGQIHKDLGEYREAINDFSRALSLKPDSLHAELYLENRAAARGMLNDNTGEVEDVDAALKMGPPRVNLFVMRAGANHDLKKYRDGISDATRAIQMDTNCTEAYAIRAMLYFAINDYIHSMDDCNRAILLGTRTASVFDVRSRLYARDGKVDLSNADKRTFSEMRERGL